MADSSYLVDDPGSYEALLTSCTSCMPNKNTNGSCPDCGFVEDITIDGEDPDSGSYSWSGDDASGQVNSRVSVTDRWPYQIKSVVHDLSCDSSCVYLIRVQYKLQTSSARRSFLQCGFSDIWLVERWNSSDVIQEMFCVATSPPFDIDNAEFAGDYTDINSSRILGSVAAAGTYFNPYGLREAYDQKLSHLEYHCGTVLFFARGNDKIKFRLAQHTNLNSNIDINPDEFYQSGGAGGRSEDYPSSWGNYDAEGTFYVKAFTRPIPGKLMLTSKSSNDFTNVKYHPKLFA